MQTTDGKIVYLLPANMQTPTSAAVLPLRQTIHQSLSSSPISTPLISRSFSEPPNDLNQIELLAPSNVSLPSNFAAVAADPLDCSNTSTTMSTHHQAMQPASFAISHSSVREHPYSLTRRALSQDSLHSMPSSSLPSTPTPPVESTSTEQKIREMEELEAKISNYKNVVEKYERLAEDATSAAIDERKIQLRKMEEQLRQREQKAKNKLANAINVMDESQVIQENVPILATPQGNQEQLSNLDVVQKPRTAGKATCLSHKF